jgi:capsular polysaccharide biosynthesis protein
VIKKYLKKIFKKISYGVFFKVYGVIENSIEHSEDNRIKVKIITTENELSYRIYTISNGRLYTDRIQDTAAILENKIIKGPSFQLRKGPGAHIFNSNIGDNIVFSKGTPRKLRNLNGSVLSLLTGGAGNNNYWHWLFDVLPRFGLCSKSTNLNKIDYFLLPSLLKQFQKETLDSLNIPEYKRISSEKFRHIQAKELIMTDHPVMLSGNATKDILNIPGWISLWLRNTFLNQTIIDNKKTKNKIYIDRNDTNSNLLPQRIIINEEEIKKYLLDKNFTIVKLHETKFINQINLFYDAECVIGLHGGGFGNIVFCKPGTKIIELKSSTASDAIKNLAKKNDLNYISLEAKAEEIYKFEFPNQQGGIKISISSLIKVLEN